MVTNPITEARWSGGYIVRELDQSLSREQRTVKQQTYTPPQVYTEAGTVLGLIGPSTGHPAATANGGNTGNGVMGTITEGAGAIVGTYTLEITTAATNAGEFDVYDPNGHHVGQGKVGVAFSNGGLAFTLADGSADFVIGDGFTIVVAASADAGKYVPLNLSATDGSQNAEEILFNTADLSAGDAKATTTARLTAVNASELVWPSGITANQIAAALAQLAKKMIIAR